MIQPILAVIASAVLRFIDGADSRQTHVKNGFRVAGFIALAVGGAWYGGHEWYIALHIGLWATLSMVIGQTDWSNPTWQAIRFGGLGAWSVLPLGASGIPYAVLCAAAGASYVVIARFDAYLPRWWIADGPEAYHRFVMGAAVIGGCWLV